MNKVYDAFGEELKVGDVIIFAVPLHCDGKGYRVTKGIVKEFTPKVRDIQHRKEWYFSWWHRKGFAQQGRKVL